MINSYRSSPRSKDIYRAREIEIRRNMVTIRYLGHSAFLMVGKAGSVLVDPFLTGNPLAAVKPSQLNPDVILVTHAHGDHLGDSIEIAERTGATILSTFELANYCADLGVNTIAANIGGTVEFDFCDVKLFPAVHSSSMDGRMLGVPCSFVVTIDGVSIFHAGDTALFGDLALIGDEFDLDLALLPIGDIFTMGPEDAVRASGMLKAYPCITTFEAIQVDPHAFCELLRKSGSRCAVLRPGEERAIPDRETS
jgi:L-ascorbate metabolism protein UlaG (beta-lactamase superfamily)